MRIATLLLPFFVAQSVVADDPIQQICSGIKNVFGCSKKVDIPTGAKAKMCPNKFFKVSISVTTPISPVVQ